MAHLARGQHVVGLELRGLFGPRVALEFGHTIRGAMLVQRIDQLRAQLHELRGGWRTFGGDRAETGRDEQGDEHHFHYCRRMSEPALDRSLFPVAESWAYCDHAAVGPLPRPTRAALVENFDAQMRLGKKGLAPVEA